MSRDRFTVPRPFTARAVRFTFDIFLAALPSLPVVLGLGRIGRIISPPSMMPAVSGYMFSHGFLSGYAQRHAPFLVGIR